MRQLVRNAYKIGHKQAMAKAEAEYREYRTQLIAAPSDVETAYLDTLKIAQRKVQGKKK